MKRWLSAQADVERYIVIDDKSDCLDDEPLFQTTAGFRPKVMLAGHRGSCCCIKEA
jgi:hypothetical protein